MRRALAVVVLLVASTTACRRTRDEHVEAGPASRLPFPDASPAPNSELARELACDDAGRGRWQYEDGPACGHAPRVDRKKPLRAEIRSGPSDPFDMLSFAFFETVAPPPDGPGPNGPLRLTLRGPNRTKREKAFDLALSLQNAGESNVLLLRALDGSFEHWRAPFVDLYAREVGGNRTYRWTFDATYGRCGNSNARKQSDYFTILPGQKIDEPFGPHANAIDKVQVMKPGRWMLWVVYAMCQGPELGVDRPFDDPWQKGAFEGTIASNALVIEVD